jgi:hypothetical protein
MEQLQREILKDAIYEELSGYLSVKMEQSGVIEKEDALEIGAFVGADFVCRIHENEGTINKDGINTVLQLVLGFFTDSIKDNFKPQDANEIVKIFGSIIQNTESRRKIIDEFQENLLPD